MRRDRSMGISRALVLVLGGLLAASPSLARDRDHDDDHGREHGSGHDGDRDPVERSADDRFKSLSLESSRAWGSTG